MLAAPAMVALARGGIFARLADGPLDLRSMSARAANVGCLFDLLSTTGWVERAGPVVQLTGCGRYAAQIASAYGVTVSYLPMFVVLPTLLFGNARIPRVDPSGFETMVNRAMNAWGGGGASWSPNRWSRTSARRSRTLCTPPIRRWDGTGSRCTWSTAT